MVSKGLNFNAFGDFPKPSFSFNSLALCTRLLDFLLPGRLNLEESRGNR